MVPGFRSLWHRLLRRTPQGSEQLQASIKFEAFHTMLREKLYQSTFAKQAELCIGISKKLFPDYENFCLVNKWGNPAMLLDAIKLSELFTRGRIGREQLKNILPKVSAIRPGSENFLGASYAINAAGAVYETIAFLTDKDVRHVADTVGFLTDTADLKIQEEEELTREQVDKHPLMTEARNFALNRLG